MISLESGSHSTTLDTERLTHPLITYKETYPRVPHPPRLVVHKLRGEGLCIHLHIPEVDLD